MADAECCDASTPEVILISDDEDDGAKLINHVTSLEKNCVNIKKELPSNGGKESVNEKGESLIVPIKKIDDEELLHRANYQVSPVLARMTTRANDILAKFLSACHPSMRTENDHRILNSIRHDVQQANLHYLASDKFYDTVAFLAERVTDDPKNIFVYIKELSDEVKAHRDKCPKAQKKSTVLSANGEATATSIASSEEGKKVNGLSPRPTTSRATASENDVSSGVERGSGQSNKDVKKEKMIKKLSSHLRRLARAAKELEEKEVDWDDPDAINSPYIMESRIKAKAVKVWAKICELEGRRPTTGREVEKKFRYNGSRYPEINVSIEKLINKKKMFPDFTDILSTIKSQNEASNLGIKSVQVQVLAEEIFRDVGKGLKTRRQRDDLELIMSRLEGTKEGDVVKDPAEEDPELQARLKESARQGKAKLDEVFQSFVTKQVEMKLEPEEVKDEDCDKSPPPSPKKGEGDAEGEEDEEEEESEDEEEGKVLLPLGDEEDTEDSGKDGSEVLEEEEDGDSEEGSPVGTQTEDSRSPIPEEEKRPALPETVPPKKAALPGAGDSAELSLPENDRPSTELALPKPQPSTDPVFPEGKASTEAAAPAEPEVITILSDDDDEDIALPRAKKPRL